MRPWFPWQLDSLWRFGAGVFLVLGATSIGNLLVLKLVGETPHADFYAVLAHSLIFHSGMMMILALLVSDHQGTWEAIFGIRFREWGKLAGPVAVGIFLCWVNAQLVGGLSAGVIEAITGEAAELQESVKMVMRMTSGWQIGLFGVITVVLAPVVEELFFRGVLFTAVTQFKGRAVGLWSTSIFFGVIHANWFSLLPLTLMGVLLALLYERTRNLLAPIAVHAAFNLINFVLVLMGAGE